MSFLSIVFVRYKKNTEKYCAMSLLPQNSEGPWDFAAMSK